MKKFLRPQSILVLIVVLGLIGVAGYFYKQNRDSQKQVQSLKQDPEQAARLASAELIDKIGKLVVLPDGEEPTIATVTDPDKLKDQAFFAKAKKDDKVLLYTKAKKAFLYNPDSNKVVEIAPINIGDSAGTAATTGTSTTGTTSGTSTTTSTKK